VIGCRILRVAIVAALLFLQGWAGPRCTACDMPCCRGEARESNTPSAALPGAAADASSAGCPSCARAAARETPADPASQPCRCILQARHDSAAVPVAKRSPIDPPHPLPGVLAAVAADRADVGGITLAVLEPRPPDRPARILYGVWRN